ncbi:MAG: nicotinate-nucleotide adenylyltransferase [Saprospiraceae bacterium]|nr:nicotinate-nucleotide adenylyltransferase [Saprospiraceae bacterium]MBK7523358.1 nicotinate-nucleotide adenylyltransferase [Saprospiraceae bacterium]MBK8548912.1 nicotinate-nucleotide adenylyltransferase [Saprospiraceae bacterium]MBK8819028.1 nicotinate-nucleotide adenylyltransferase [Saprospiraceae bacterium]MBK9041924.1 nicotinate-nucleotide adenylyltransferase [Saprospiraceae bacterium]
MKIGLFFGSFNPIHIGHLIIADYIAQFTDLTEVWLVVSPQNPLKQKNSLAKDHDRLHLATIATENNPRLKVSSIEFTLPKPSYTIDTLVYLKEKYPDKTFTLIMGSDNIQSINKWKNFEKLLEDYDILVYNRQGYDQINPDYLKRVHFVDAPLLHLSSTMIRERISQGKSIQYLVPDVVFHYLENSNLYKTKKKT